MHACMHVITIASYPGHPMFFNVLDGLGVRLCNYLSDPHPPIFMSIPVLRAILRYTQDLYHSVIIIATGG
jgi:hypothetical protein